MPQKLAIGSPIPQGASIGSLIPVGSAIPEGATFGEDVTSDTLNLVSPEGRRQLGMQPAPPAQPLRDYDPTAALGGPEYMFGPTRGPAPTPDPRRTMAIEPVPQFVRSATGVLPAAGATVGGVASGAAGLPSGPGAIATSAAGVGLGAAAGKQAELGLNRAIFGADETSPISREGLAATGKEAAIAAGTTGVLESLGPVISAIGQRRDLNRIFRGKESVFRAARPGSSKADISFRDNLSEVAGDLAEIERQTPLTGAGGFRNPDMRLRNFGENIRKYLSKMYDVERAPVIQQASLRGGQVVLQVHPGDLQLALKNLDPSPSDDALRATISSLSTNPNSPIPISQADELARAVNVKMNKFQAMTPQDQAASTVKDSDIATLKQLDVALSKGINSKLNELGLPDILRYERRYAGLNPIALKFETGANQAELTRLMDRVGEFIRVPLGGTRITGGASLGGLQPSAGRKLQTGVRKLAKSSIRPQKGVSPDTDVFGSLPRAAQTGQLSFAPVPEEMVPAEQSAQIPLFGVQPTAAPRPMPLARVAGRAYREPGGIRLPQSPIGREPGLPNFVAQPLAENRQLPAFGQTSGPQVTPPSWESTPPYVHQPNMPRAQARPQALGEREVFVREHQPTGSMGKLSQAEFDRLNVEELAKGGDTPIATIGAKRSTLTRVQDELSRLKLSTRIDKKRADTLARAIQGKQYGGMSDADRVPFLKRLSARK